MVCRTEPRRRKFAFEVTEEEATTQYNRIHGWGYTSPSTVKKPTDMEDENSCLPLYSQLPSPSADEMDAADKHLALPVSHPMYETLKKPWLNSCYFLMYFDGQSQPARVGTDIRVHLPRTFDGKLSIETQDNDEEDLYPRRGDVKVDGLCGEGDISVTNGNVDIRMRCHFSAAISADGHDRETLARGAIARRVDIGCDMIMQQPDDLIDQK